MSRRKDSGLSRTTRITDDEVSEISGSLASLQIIQLPPNGPTTPPLSQNTIKNDNTHTSYASTGPISGPIHADDLAAMLKEFTLENPRVPQPETAHVSPLYSKFPC